MKIEMHEISFSWQFLLGGIMCVKISELLEIILTLKITTVSNIFDSPITYGRFD